MPDHIHIISAGESIHKTYPVSIKSLKDIRRTYVIVEKNVYKILPGDDEKKKLAKKGIVAAIKEVEKISQTLSIEYDLVNLDELTIETVRDAVMDIYDEHPNSTFSFNISGGTKILSIGLFIMSIWLEGESYHTPGGEQIQKLSIPKMHVKDISANTNYVEILSILNNAGADGISRQTLFQKLEKVYKPVRDMGEKTTKRKLEGGTLTKLTESLLEWRLIHGQYKSGSKKEKLFTITPDGILALRFVKIKEKKESIH
ncbi:MAG: hypothetical protein Q8T08_16075 [Ignavibacteria bacterium]|nr:hypothetical protein [Ignavibacteria bacterium]